MGYSLQYIYSSDENCYIHVDGTWIHFS